MAANTTKSNSDNFLNWQEVEGTLPLSKLQQYGIDKCDSCRFIYKITIANPQTISVPMYDSDDSLYNFKVDFGDGGDEKFVNAYADAGRKNTYANAGTYTIVITGIFEYIKFADNPISLIEIKQWGDSAIGGNSFSGCSNLNAISAIDIPSIYQNTLIGCFINCTSFNVDISHFDTSAVTDMSGMFSGCSIFNQKLTFDTANVENMSEMFRYCNSFDQTLGNLSIFNLSDATNLLDGVTISTINYDDTLVAWEAQTHEAIVVVSFGGSLYTTPGLAEDARDALIGEGWTITDGGPA